MLIFLLGCNELQLNQTTTPSLSEAQIILNTRSELSKEALDSTNQAEKHIKTNGNSFTNQVTTGSPINNLINYAPSATVSAQSTYPGYSVTKINDGSENTTVGPSYSWANNYPDGTRLPQSVFLKFNSLKKISRIDIYTSSGYALQNYTIQFRTTPTATWITLVTVTGNLSVHRTHTFADVNLLEVQIICQLGPPNQTIYGRLNEVELYGSVEPTLPAISVQNGMLSFNSDTDVDQTIAYLEYKYDQYSDAFASQYPGLTADQLADVEETTGFNDDQPYIDFENMYGISSLRSSLAAQEDYWLDNTAGDSTAGQDPDDLYMDDYEMRTITNSNGYLKVGATYYVFQSDASYYTSSTQPVPFAHVVANQTSVITFAAAGCRSTVGKHNFQPTASQPNGSWRFKWKVSVWDGPFAGPGKVKAITKSYKKKNGHWKKRGAILGVQAYGDIVGQDCSGGTSVDSGYREWSKPHRKIKSYKLNPSNLAVKKNQMHGYHYHKEIGNYTSTLSW